MFWNVQPTFPVLHHILLQRNPSAFQATATQLTPSKPWAVDSIQAIGDDVSDELDGKLLVHNQPFDDTVANTEILSVRAVISVDMGHCKPPMSHGQLVMVSVWDGNDNTLIAGHGHVPTEDVCEWTFALECTSKAFPTLCRSGFAILSDQDKVR